MKISINGLALIKKYEGFKSKPYLCPAGKATVGYGSTYYEDDTKVQLTDDPITEEKALELLKFTSDKVYGDFINKNVTVELNQNQFDALCSFAYNVGNGNLKKSTLLKYVNQSKFEDASLEFSKWTRSNGKVLNGLIRRRFEEKNLFLKK